MTAQVAAWRASYTGGDWLVLSGPTAVVALDPDTTLTGPEIERIWRDVVASASMDDMVARLAPVDRSVSPRLLAVFWDDGGLRTLVRGDLTLREVRTGNPVARGDGVITWREAGLDGVTSVVAALPGPHGNGGQALPLVVGAVRAGSVRIDAAPDAALSSPQLRGPVAEPSAPSEPNDSGEDPWDTPTRRADGPPGEGDAEPGVAAEDLPPAEQDRDTDDHGPTGDQNDADRADDDQADDDQNGKGPTDEDPTDGDPSEDEAARLEMENADTSLMDPALLPTVSAPAPVVPGPAGAPLVDAVVCVRGHLNPPYATGCWVCGESVPEQSPQSVPRPVLARLRLPDGSVAPLDGPILIGRAPSDTGQAGETAQLITVASPGHDISRTHVLVAPEGWQILITDLGSTNGTTVVSPGPGVDRVTLSPRQPLSVALGTLIELGDGVAVLIDAAE